jgi:hypothetical protein
LGEPKFKTSCKKYSCIIYFEDVRGNSMKLKGEQVTMFLAKKLCVHILMHRANKSFEMVH